MGFRVYVGNLVYSIDGDELKKFFEEKVGAVRAVQIIRDAISGRSKGFAFVEFHNKDHVNKAIELLNGFIYQGRRLKVARAKPIVPKPPRSGFGKIRF